MEKFQSQTQKELWNGVSGRAWVDGQALLDRILQPFEDRLVAELSAGAGERVLDVGCGTGSTTLAFARRVGPSGRVTGIDISAPMIASARARAENERAMATFVLADVQTHAFAPASFDAILSRFGVMFFEDPARAFANLRTAAAAGGRLRAIAWRSGDENPFMTTAERVAAPFLPALPPRRPGEPGQFAFADRDRVHRILRESGWSSIALEPIDLQCAMPEPALMPYLTRFGPVGRLLAAEEPGLRTEVLEKLRVAFEPYVHGDEVRFTTACWLITGTA